MLRRLMPLLGGLALCSLAARFAHADTIDDIRHRGHLVCDVSTDTDDYSEYDGHGDLSAFETAYCRAIAASILGDPKRATIQSRNDEISGLRDVRDGRADLMIGATPYPAIGLAMHLQFASPILIDGQGFLVDPRLAIHTPAEIKGARVCFNVNTPQSEMLGPRLDEMGDSYVPFDFSERGEMMGALATNHCNLMTGDVSELANERLSLPALKPFVVLPQTITTDPLSPAVRTGDEHLMTIVDAVDDGLLQAEEQGVTQANAADLTRTAQNPLVRRIVGTDGWIGPSLGLDNRWLLRAVEAVGNHAEIFDRTVGAGSRLHLAVGANRPVSQGGALVALPVFSPP